MYVLTSIPALSACARMITAPSTNETQNPQLTRARSLFLRGALDAGRRNNASIALIGVVSMRFTFLTFSILS